MRYVSATDTATNDVSGSKASRLNSAVSKAKDPDFVVLLRCSSKCQIRLLCTSTPGIARLCPGSYTALPLLQWRRRMPCEHLRLPYHAVFPVGAVEMETSLPCARLQSSGDTATLADNLRMCGRPVGFRSQPYRLRSGEGVSRAASRTQDEDAAPFPPLSPFMPARPSNVPEVSTALSSQDRQHIVAAMRMQLR
jgi:hypothetical protein